MTISLALLATLGGIILLVGIVVFVVGAFRASIVWGALVLLPPLLIGGVLAMGWLPLPSGLVVLGVIPLIGVVFLLLKFDKAKDGLVIMIVGCLLPVAAAYLLIAADEREKLITSLKEMAANYTSPDPFAGNKTAGGEDKAGKSKKPPPAIPQTQVLDFSSVGGAQAPADVGIRTPTTVVAPTAGLLENDVQVTAAFAELTQKSKELAQRKERLKGSNETAELIALKSEIESYNKRLAEVRAAEQRIFAIKMQAVADQRLAAVPKNKTSGSLQGRQVVFEHAELDRKRAMLTFKQGDLKAPEVTVTVMFGARVDEPFDKKRVVRDPAGDNSPAISVTMRGRTGQPLTKSFNRGYGLYVEFAEDQPEGRIFLTLPDESKSLIQGTFRLASGGAEKRSG